MGAYLGVGAYFSSSGSEVGAYSGGGLIREWGLNRSFTVCSNCRNKSRFDSYELTVEVSRVSTVMN